ncbi:MAG: hypothetical protein FWG52_09355 [Proteobacteria bacterium]|nr:hypothetical protein [Pseudomonadota bacterium]
MHKERKTGKKPSRWTRIIALARSEGWSVVKCNADCLVLRKTGWPVIQRGMPVNGSSSLQTH